MSHELRTPLNAALGFAELLESDPALDLPAERKAWLVHMAGACRHVVDLVQDLLDLSRLEQGAMPLHCRPLALQPLAQQAIALLEPAAGARRVTLRCTEQAPPTHAQADPRALRQVLLNLLSNAVKYNRHGGHVEVRLRAEDRVLIEVQDTGPGLEPAQLAHLFEPFNRLGAEGSEIEGSGLGLVITRRLVEAMAGSIAVHSECSIGTRVIVALPPAPAC
jgi:signal transduction histidine kinase